MTFYEHKYDTERGISSNQYPTTRHSQRFLLFRDVAFVSIIILHISTAILSLSLLVTRSAAPETHGYMGVMIFTGMLTPVLAVIGYRDHLQISKWTSALWFELSWTIVIMVMDFIVTVAHSSVKAAQKSLVVVTYFQTIVLIIYGIVLGGLILLQHRKFPDVPIWELSVQSVQWLESSSPAERGNPSVCPFPPGNSKPAPWNADYDNEKSENQFVKTPETGVAYVNAHPFWQARVERQAAAEDDMAYIVQRYGLEAEAAKLKATPSKSQKSRHSKRPSIRDLGISRPVPVASTVRRANTLAARTFEPSLHHVHRRAGSVGSYDQLYRGTTPPRIHRGLDVPVDVDVAYPEPAARAIRNPVMGLASRTLVGTSRPKASASRHTDTSKPLPSPPPMSTSESFLSSDPSAPSSHNFVMEMAQRVKISASNVAPIMVQTPKAVPRKMESPIDMDKDDFSDVDWKLPAL